MLLFFQMPTNLRTYSLGHQHHWYTTPNTDIFVIPPSLPYEKIERKPTFMHPHNLHLHMPLNNHPLANLHKLPITEITANHLCLVYHNCLSKTAPCPELWPQLSSFYCRLTSLIRPKCILNSSDLSLTQFNLQPEIYFEFQHWWGQQFWDENHYGKVRFGIVNVVVFFGGLRQEVVWL